jgi:hypothetical protein
LNPVRAKLVKAGEPLKRYRWSSWPEYLKRPGKRPPWLRVDRLLGEWGIKSGSRPSRRRLELAMAQRQELDRSNEDWKRLRRGWCLGPKEFREELLEMIEEQKGQQHYGEEIREKDEQRAARLIAGAMRKWHWKRAELKARRKGDRRKVELARRLREETTMTWQWIAERLVMGHWRTAYNAVHHSNENGK